MVLIGWLTKMEKFFNTIFGTVISLGAILTVAVTGLLYMIGIWSKGKKDQKDSNSKEEDRLINILKTTVEELETKVNKQTLDIKNLTEEVHELKRENGKYIEIFQGRNEETKKFYERAYIAIDTVQQTHDIITTMAESIKNTNTALQGLIGILSQSVDVVGKIAGK